jgi:PAS domain S-box-containing protein
MTPLQTKPPIRILHLEDNPSDILLIKRTLAAEGLVCDVVSARSRSEFEIALEQPQYDLILSDYTIPGYGGMAALSAARQKHPEAPFIFLSGTIGEEAAIESLKRGAVDYVLKDKPARLVAAVKRALQDAIEQSRRNQQDQQLREQAALLDLACDAIIVTGMGGFVRYWNKGAERLHGWKMTEVVGRSTKEFLYLDLSWYAEAVRILHERGDWSGDVAKSTKAGTELLMHTHWTLVRDSAGKPESVLSISTDITERKKLEEQFLRAQRLESIGALAGGIAHDLNNIFSPILMSCQVLEEQVSLEERNLLLANITASAQRGSEMVGRILTFARGTGGIKQHLLIDAVVSEVFRLLQSVLPRTVKPELKLEPNLPPVLGNSTQLHQILMNLCINARDAMPGGGKLIISTQLTRLEKYVTRWELQAISGSFVTIQVTDTGQGIPPEILDRLFEPFFSTKSPGKGTGLGLATVRGIVRNHGGFLEVSSQPGSGSTFQVHLPAATGNSQTR